MNSVERLKRLRDLLVAIPKPRRMVIPVLFWPRSDAEPPTFEEMWASVQRRKGVKPGSMTEEKT